MDSGGKYNSGRDGGRGRGRGGGRGGYQNQGGRGRGSGSGSGQNQPNQGGGRGWAAAPQRGSHHQPSAPQQWVSRPPVRTNQPAPPATWVRPQMSEAQQPQPAAPSAWGNRPQQTLTPQQPHPAQSTQPAPPSAWGNRPQQTSAPQQPHPAHSNQPAAPSAWGNRPQLTSAPQQPHPVGVGPSSGRSSLSTPRSWGPSSSSPPGQAHAPQIPPPLPSADQLVKPMSSVSVSGGEGQIQPIRRPDQGGTLAVRTIGLLVNHFRVDFNEESTIIHYDVEIKPESSNGGGSVKKPLRKSDARFIKDQLFAGNKLLKSAYDGEKSIFSAIKLPEGQFKVDIAEGEDTKSGSYMVTVKLVSVLKLSKLNDYLRGNLSYSPRDCLQAMDLVMKENPRRRRFMVGRGFISSKGEVDLGGGIAAYKGFKQSLPPTLQGLALCLDYSTLSFRKPIPVLDFLKNYIYEFRGANDVKNRRKEVEQALQGLKVRVNHRRTNQKYTISGLAPNNAADTFFELEDPEGKSTQRVNLVQYFKDKWGKDLKYKNIPCLEVGKNKRSNQVPMEFCVLVEGQRYPKEDLDRDTALFLKNITLAKPQDRMRTILDMVRSDDGPCGDIAKNFGITLDQNMTKVTGRVIGAPKLKVGSCRPVEVDVGKCQWNLLRKSFVDGKSVDRWALIDFTGGFCKNKLLVDAFVNNLTGRCRGLGIQMAGPLVYRCTGMNEFSSVKRLENLLKSVVEESGKIDREKLQIIVCVMAEKDPGYKHLKWVSETQIGVVTQCCLVYPANKGQDQYFSNLCLKINAKLGGNNFELSGKPLHFGVQEHVMFIGADVNHPAPMNKSCPSIAAVVGSVNWPAANRYAARVSPQVHRCEKINNFGSLCLDLIRTYEQLNRVKPRRIVVFRDGVSEGQFDMVLNEELLDLKRSIYTDDYQPPITLIVAQKRHQTRLSVENRNDGGTTGNVPPGTVVDTRIVHPQDFDFYLCSHYGGIGTSKPTHYYVLWDENGLSSDQWQKLTYDMCFIFVRCTKPVSLVPPVYYADIVASRGRMFQEVAIDVAGTESAATTASFDQNFYKLHSDLENAMFFV